MPQAQHYLQCDIKIDGAVRYTCQGSPEKIDQVAAYHYLFVLFIQFVCQALELFNEKTA